MKYTTILLTLSISACSTLPEKPPEATGELVPINDLNTAEMLAHDAGFVIVGENRSEPEVREYFLYNGLRQIAKPTSDRRRMFRDPRREDYAYIQGADYVERTVSIPFAYASKSLNLTPEQRYKLRLLSAVADRIQVRGRTDGRGNQRNNERMARARAEAAQRHLLSIGVPHEIISLNYQANGDYVSDDHTARGRAQNRRVEIEFFIDDFTVDKPFQVALKPSIELVDKPEPKEIEPVTIEPVTIEPAEPEASAETDVVVQAVPGKLESLRTRTYRAGDKTEHGLRRFNKERWQFIEGRL